MKVRQYPSTSSCEDGARGELFIKESIVGRVNSQQVGHLGTGTQDPYYAFEPYLRLFQGRQGLRWACA